LKKQKLLVIILQIKEKTILSPQTKWSEYDLEVKDFIYAMTDYNIKDKKLE